MISWNGNRFNYKLLYFFCSFLSFHSFPLSNLFDNDSLLNSGVGIFTDEFVTSSEDHDPESSTENKWEGSFLPNEVPEEDAFNPTNENLGTFHNDSPSLPNQFHIVSCGNLSIVSQTVKCFPQPDALNPCEDVMGSHWLRASVWIVVSFTVFGNISVLVVILSSR